LNGSALELTIYNPDRGISAGLVAGNEVGTILTCALAVYALEAATSKAPVNLALAEEVAEIPVY
jgi:hypothetical protein